MEKTITEAELSERLLEILDRVEHHGERFVVERDGVVVATINPARSQPGITVKELIARVGDLPMPGDGFADDLEAIQASQGVAKLTEWPD